MKKWRLISPSTQLIVEPASGARAVIRDTSADGAYRFHWSVIPSEESLPMQLGAPADLHGRDRSPRRRCVPMPRIGVGCYAPSPRQLPLTPDHIRQRRFVTVGPG